MPTVILVPTSSTARQLAAVSRCQRVRQRRQSAACDATTCDLMTAETAASSRPASLSSKTHVSSAASYTTLSTPLCEEKKHFN